MGFHFREIFISHIILDIFVVHGGMAQGGVSGLEPRGSEFESSPHHKRLRFPSEVPI